MTPAVGVVAAGLGTGAAVVVTRWLETRGYRYEDEADVRRRSHRWVLPTLPVVVTLVALGQLRAGGVAAAAVVGALAAVLVVVSAIDLDVRRLPDRFTGPLLVASAVGLAGVALADGQWSDWVRALAAAAAVGAAYLALALAGGGNGLGLGDVKLAPTLGLLLGWHSWSHVVLGTVLAFVIGGLVGLVLILRGRDRRSTLPFGPFMVGSCLTVLALPAFGSLL